MTKILRVPFSWISSILDGLYEGLKLVSYCVNCYFEIMYIKLSAVVIPHLYSFICEFIRVR